MHDTIKQKVKIFVKNNYNKFSPRLGYVSRLRLLQSALNFRYISSEEVHMLAGTVILDTNEHRIRAAKLCLSEPCNHIKIQYLGLSLSARCKFLICLILSRRVRSQVYCSEIVCHLNKHLNDAASIFIYNPYSALAFSLFLIERKKIAFWLTPNYNIDVFADLNICIRSIKCLKQIPTARWLEKKVTNIHVEDSPAIVFYLSSQDHCSEQRLFKLLWFCVETTKEPIRVVLHPRETQANLLRLKSKLPSRVELIINVDSLLRVHESQISFSEVSSVGYELLSLGVRHFVLFDELRFKRFGYQNCKEYSENFIFNDEIFFNF